MNRALRRYAGVRTDTGCRVFVYTDEPVTVYPNGQAVPVVSREPYEELPVRLDLWNHSPDGFEWGYGGSGPAQLALALLADALGDDREAVRLHQDFKWQFVCAWRGARWSMTAAQIREWASQQTPEEEKSNG